MSQSGITLAFIFPLVYGIVYSMSRTDPTNIMSMIFPFAVLFAFFYGFVKLK